MKIFSIILFLLICIASSNLLLGQKGYSKHLDSDGPGMSIRNIISVHDTLFITGVRRDEFTNIQGIYWAKLDTNGVVLDSKLVLDSIGDNLGVGNAYSIIHTSDNAFLLCGTVIPRTSGVLLKLDVNGNLIWFREFVFDFPDVRNTHLNRVTEIPGGFIISGSQVRDDYFHDFFSIKTDKQGNIVWYKTYGEPEVNEFCIDMEKVDENVFVLTGAKYSSVYPPVDERLYNSTLLYIDSTGKVIEKWDADTNSESSANNYKQVENEFVYSATTREIYEDEVGDKYFFNIPIIVRRDSGFREVWRYTIDCEPVFENVIFSMEQLADGNFLAVGKWALPGHLPPEVKIHGCMLKISPEGEKIWSRCDTVPGYSFGYSKFWLCGVAELSSGSIIAAGGHDDTQLPGAKSYGWLVKVDKDGCMVDTLCTTTSLYEQILEKEQLVVWPNPTSEDFTISSPEHGLLQVFTLDGSEVFRSNIASGRHKVQSESWASGLYLLTLQGKSGTYTGKVIIE